MIYLHFAGTATVVDQCTTVGPILTNPIISLPPGGLSTWQPKTQYPDWMYIFTIGQIWNDPKGSNIQELGLIDFTKGIAPIDLKDLACPTWGLGYSTSDDGTVITTIGPPYLPVVIPPTNVFSLNSIWTSVCTGMYTDPAFKTTLALFDPPTALTTAALLLPTPAGRPTAAEPTTVANQISPSVESAKPAPVANHTVATPARTGDPGKADPTDPKAPVVPVPSARGGSPAITDDPENAGSTELKAPVVPVSSPGEDHPARRQSFSAIIYGTFGKSEPGADRSSPTPGALQSITTIGARTLTTNLTGFTTSKVAVTPSGTPHVVDNTTISLGRSGVLSMGNSTVPLVKPVSSTVLAVVGQTSTADPLAAGGLAITAKGTSIHLEPSGAISLTDPSSTPFTITVGGQTFTPNPSAFSAAGTTTSAGGPAITVNRTIISLGQSGALAIGSSTVNIPLQSYIPSEVYTIAGQTFTPNPSAFFIANTTISPDGPAATINRTIISLRPSRTLIIGSSTIPLSRSHFSSVDIDNFDV